MASPRETTTVPFLLMEGGPLYLLEKRIGLMAKDSPKIVIRAVIAVCLTWVPLLILSALQGVAIGRAVAVPFLIDYSAYTRFLLAIPLLLLAESILGPRIAEVAEHFVKSGLVAEADYGRFDDAIRRGLKMRDSVIAEIVIAVLAFVVATSTTRGMAMQTSNWHWIQNDGGHAPSWAGWWLTFFCAPLLQFLVIRWLWRLFLWFQFLGRVRKLHLDLVPTHPDRAAGLGFVGEAQRFFGILLFAYSTSATGALANQIVYDKVPLQHFAIPIALYLVCGLTLVTGPLVLFAGLLLQTKREGLLEYGTFATTYTSSFHRRWILGMNESGEALLGTGDIQSLADLGNSFEFIERMNAVPTNPRSILNLLVAAAIPMVPLLLTIMSPKEILQLLLKVLV